jgi:hypothetical protein
MNGGIEVRFSVILLAAIVFGSITYASSAIYGFGLASIGKGGKRSTSMRGMYFRMRYAVVKKHPFPLLRVAWMFFRFYFGMFSPGSNAADSPAAILPRPNFIVAERKFTNSKWGSLFGLTDDIRRK